ncbi:MAG: SPFH domain-containing protein [Patescibacteria group bacterium]|nr:SPFH domain-containing protein [Patescibacteria group bacterium]
MAGLRVVQQYERGVVLTLGRYSSTRLPGLNWILVGIQKMIKVDVRVRTIDIPRQEVITSDNVTVGINAVVFVRVERAEDAVLKVQDHVYVISQYALGALRDVIGGVELDVLLTQRERIAEEIKKNC